MVCAGVPTALCPVFMVVPSRSEAHFAARLNSSYTVPILDYSKVCVKPLFLQHFAVREILYYQALCDEIVRLLRQEREHRKLSNYAVSQRSGVSESMLSLVERRLRNPTMELMLRVADGIGADLPALIQKATATMLRQRDKSGAARKRGAVHS